MSWYKISQEIQESELKKAIRSTSEMMAKILHKPPGFIYASLYDFIHKNGHEFKSAPLTPEEMEVVKEFIEKAKSFKQKECFYNAQKISTCSDLKYVEGFVMDAKIPIPIEHAWNSINNKVIDFTLKHLNGGEPIIGIIPPGLEYIGTFLSRKRIFQIWKKGFSEQIIGYRSPDLFQNEFNQEAEM